MSGFIGKLRGLFTSSVGDAVSEAIEDHVTPERIDGVLDKVPGGDFVRDHVPEDAGQQIGGAARGYIAGDEPPADPVKE